MNAIHPLRRWQQCLVCLIVWAALHGGVAFGDIEKVPRPEPASEAEGPPNAFRHIGNFFYHLANRLEQAGLPAPPMPPPFYEPPPRKPKRTSAVPPANLTPSSSAQYFDTTGSRQDQPVPPLKKPTTPVPQMPKLATPPPESLDPAFSPAPKKAPEKKLEKPADGAVTDPNQPAVKPVQTEIPTAVRSKTFGRVKSPFPPYNELDVSGLGSGTLARDPTSGHVFRVP